MIFLAVVFITSDVTMAQTNDNNYIDDYTDEESYKEINEILRNNGWKGDDFEQIVSTAASGDTSWNLHLTETIAEAIHDYYLHGNNCSKSSYEIVNIIKSRL